MEQNQEPQVNQEPAAEPAEKMFTQAQLDEIINDLKSK